MFQRCLATATLAGATAIGLMTPAHANNPIWETWQPIFSPAGYNRPYTQARQEFIPSRQGNIPYQMQQAAYHSPQTNDTAINCGLSDALNLPDRCIGRTQETREGLANLMNYLHQKTAEGKIVSSNGYLPNTALLETVQALLNWHENLGATSLAGDFDLLPIESAKGSGAGNFTGYFTPLLQVSHTPSARFSVPIYGKPPGKTSFSSAEIANGALAGRNLEIAWTDDPWALHVAQVQGSTVAEFQDGTRRIFEYAGNNNHSFTSPANYMKSQGYIPRNFGNDGIGEWLHQHPEKMTEVLTKNPRYIFFQETSEAPTTSSGQGVIPGHTIAVDGRFIPHGSVILAELPRLDTQGNPVGTEWRLLFAQDNGKAITGNGRFDLYTGAGPRAEAAAHAITGGHRAFLLMRKNGGSRNPSHIAGL
jgi:membrane-bound lytic murein transglycosylase A